MHTRGWKMLGREAQNIVRRLKTVPERGRMPESTRPKSREETQPLTRLCTPSRDGVLDDAQDKASAPKEA